jgi:predicted phage-related endonuclease
MTAAVGDLITPAGRLVLPPGADRAQWLEYRRWRENVPGKYCIGASEVPSILDLDGVDTPAHVFRVKRDGLRVKQSEPMLWGHLLEAPIADEWTRRNRCVTDEIGLVANADTPWHQCTVDRRVQECPVDGGTCLLEVKNVGYSSASRWRTDLPDRIYAQILFQMHVTGYRHAHYACLIGGNMMKQGIIWADREREVIDYIVTEVDAFRENHLIPGIEPAWDTSRKAAKLIELDSLSHPTRTGEIGIDELDDVLAYAEAQAAESAARKRKERALAGMRQHADGHEVVTFGGDLVYRFGTQTRRSVKIDRLAEKYPDAAADPEIVSETTSHPVYLGREYKVRQS